MKSTASAKIKQTRSLLGYSQAELAQISKLSLRTIQRIENGETNPRGDTLKRLSSALNILPAEFAEALQENNKAFLILHNLSALSFIVFPLFGVLVPLVLWALKKDKINHVYRYGKDLLNMQITCCLLVLILYITTITAKIMHIGFRVPVVGVNSFDFLFITYCSVYVVNTVFIVANVFRIMYDKPVNYFAGIRFLR